VNSDISTDMQLLIPHTQEAEESLIYVGTTPGGRIRCQKVAGCITRYRSLFRGPADEIKISELRDDKIKQGHVWEHVTALPVANSSAMMDVKLIGLPTPSDEGRAGKYTLSYGPRIYGARWR